MTRRRTSNAARDAAEQRESYKRHLDARLDEALEETFPASDPIAVTPRRGRGTQPPAATQKRRRETQ